jgi:polyphosphate kinase
MQNILVRNKLLYTLYTPEKFYKTQKYVIFSASLCIHHIETWFTHINITNIMSMRIIRKSFIF